MTKPKKVKATARLVRSVEALDAMKVECLNIASRTHCGNAFKEIVTAAKAYYDFLKS